MARHFLGPDLHRRAAYRRAPLHALRGPGIRCRERRAGGAYRPGPDNYWFGARPHILLDRRAPGVDEMIARVRGAVADYPYPDTYRPRPGPNSNTFLAHTARQVPEPGIHLLQCRRQGFPARRLIVCCGAQRIGFQVSLYGLCGILLAAREGLEVSLLGLSLRVDPVGLALKVPALAGLRAESVGAVQGIPGQRQMRST
jgi:uncharacterized protein DUF3750